MSAMHILCRRGIWQFTLVSNDEAACFEQFCLEDLWLAVAVFLVAAAGQDLFMLTLVLVPGTVGHIL